MLPATSKRGGAVRANAAASESNLNARKAAVRNEAPPTLIVSLAPLSSSSPASLTVHTSVDDRNGTNNASLSLEDDDNALCENERGKMSAFREAHSMNGEYCDEYPSRSGNELALHPQPVDAENVPYIYRPESAQVDVVLATLDKFDLYDTLSAVASIFPAEEEPKEPDPKPSEVTASSWRASLKERSHQDEFFKRSHRALAPGKVAVHAIEPLPAQPAKSSHELQDNAAKGTEVDDCAVPDYGLNQAPKKKNRVYLQHGLRQQKKRIGDGSSVGCVDRGLCNELLFCSEVPGCIDITDANSIDGRDLGEIENEHARRVKERRDWLQSICGVFFYLAADRDDRISVVDTLRTEFSPEVGAVRFGTGFRWTKQGSAYMVEADRKVSFARECQSSKHKSAPDVNAFWYLFRKNY